MDPHVAVAHYPEGAGHATRMLAVAQALEGAGATVSLAGGGPGAKFVELNGYEQFEPAQVDYIEDFQDGGNLLNVVTNSVPTSGKRVVDYVRWLREREPDALVTDDMFAAMAAPVTRTPLYVLTHNAPGFYEAAVEEVFTWLLTEYQKVAGREFLYPAVWDASTTDPDGVTRIPPIALEGSQEATDGGARRDPDVLVVPSHYSEGFSALARRLRDDGHDVTLVGDDTWEPVPALLPLVRRADVVVCSGYSTVMEAAVAGTPCLIFPFTDEQRGVARVITAGRTEGFRRVDTHTEIVEAVRDPPCPPQHANGAGVAADRVLADL